MRLQGEDVEAEAVNELALHERILTTLTEHPGTSGNRLAATARARKEDVYAALEQLTKAGKVDSVKKGRATRWFVVGATPLNGSQWSASLGNYSPHPVNGSRVPALIAGTETGTILGTIAGDLRRRSIRIARNHSGTMPGTIHRECGGGMAEEERDDEEAERERQVLARSGHLQARLLALLNDPAESWALQPCIAAHALAETLRLVLGYVVAADGSRLPWALDLLDYIRPQVAAAAGSATATPGERRH